MINAHRFPPNFQFNVIKGVKHATQKSLAMNNDSSKNVESQRNSDVYDLSNSFAKLSIPRSVQLLKKSKDQE